MIIWLASYPRSGNTMFRMALHHLYGIKTHSVYADNDIVQMGAASEVGHETLRKNMVDLSLSNEAYFVKIHDRPPSNIDSHMAIHIVRDGRDALTSYAHYRVNINKLPMTASESLDDLLTRSSHIWGGWSGHARSWFNWPGKRVLVKYEDMVKDISSVVERALIQLNIRLTRKPDAHMPKFGSLNDKWPQFFRKGVVGSWATFMTAEQLQLFWSRHLDMMKELHYV